MKSQVAKQEKLELVQDNWYNILKQIKEEKGRVGTMADLIKAKNTSPFENELWQNGAYVSTTLDYAQNQPVILIANGSDLLNLKNAKKAVKAHSQGNEFYISQEAYNSHLKQAEKESKKAPEKRTLFILPTRDNFNITAQNYFEVLRFLAQDPKQAEKYLERLSEKGINELTLYLINKEYVDAQKTPFERQLWSHWLGSRAGLVGYCGGLSNDSDWAVSVSPLLGEARAQKISGQKKPKEEVYTPKQIMEATREIILSGNVKIEGLDALILRNLRDNN